MQMRATLNLLQESVPHCSAIQHDETWNDELASVLDLSRRNGCQGAHDCGMDVFMAATKMGRLAFIMGCSSGSEMVIVDGVVSVTVFYKLLHHGFHSLLISTHHDSILA